MRCVERQSRRAARGKTPSSARPSARPRAQQQQANSASVTSALAEADASLRPTGVASVLAAVDGGEITNGPALERLGYAGAKPRRLLPPDARGPRAGLGRQ